MSNESLVLGLKICVTKVLLSIILFIVENISYLMRFSSVFDT